LTTVTQGTTSEVPRTWFLQFHNIIAGTQRLDWIADITTLVGTLVA